MNLYNMEHCCTTEIRQVVEVYDVPEGVDYRQLSRVLEQTSFAPSGTRRIRLSWHEIGNRKIVQKRGDFRKNPHSSELSNELQSSRLISTSHPTHSSDQNDL